VLADIIDHGDVVTGERRAGAYAAIYYLVVKVGLALGVGLAFGLLQLIHFDPGNTHHSLWDAWIIGFWDSACRACCM
jgi:Na+/melibiose symporter-like transporter